MAVPEMKSPQSRRTTRWRVHALLTFVLLAFFLPTIAYEYVVNDALSAALASWRIAEVGNGWFDNFPVDQVPLGSGQELWIATASNGHVAVFRSPGVILLGVPAYLLVSSGASVSDFSVVPAGVTAALLAVVAMNLFLAALRGVPHRDALLCVFALALTTPMWTVNANSLWPHAATVLGIAGMAWSASTNRWVALGLFGGLALWGRLHAVVIIAIVGLGLAIWRRNPRIALMVGAVSVTCLALAVVWTRWMYGDWSPTGGYPGPDAYAARISSNGFRDHLENAAGLLVAPDRGLLVWTPILVLLMPAVVRGWLNLPDWSRLLALAGIAYTGVQALLNGFTGGSSFYGYRLTLELLACLFPAIVYSTSHIGARAKQLIGPVLGLQFAAMTIGATSEGFLLPYDRAWEDNSLALAVRTFPALTAWLLLMVLVGFLASRVWQERMSGSPAPVRLE